MAFQAPDEVSSASAVNEIGAELNEAVRRVSSARRTQKRNSEIEARTIKLEQNKCLNDDLKRTINMAEVENNSDDDVLKRTRNIAKVEEVPDDLQTPLPSNIASSQPLGKLLGRRVPHGRLRPKS